MAEACVCALARRTGAGDFGPFDRISASSSSACCLLASTDVLRRASMDECCLGDTKLSISAEGCSLSDERFARRVIGDTPDVVLRRNIDTCGVVIGVDVTVCGNCAAREALDPIPACNHQLNDIDY